MLSNVADYGPAPLEDPSTYPGRWPAQAVMLVGARVVPVPPTASVKGRRPLLATGSNACPAQLRAKGLEGQVLLTPTVLRNHLIVYAGHITTYGALPATIVRWPGARSWVFTAWLTPRQEHVVHRSEGGNYDTVMLPTNHGVVPGYRAVTGVLTRDGLPVRLPSVSATGQNLPPALAQDAARRHHASIRTKL